VRRTREHDRLLVVNELQRFDDGEASYGQLLWVLRRTGLMGDADQLRRRTSQAVRGLDASGVVLVTEGLADDEPTVLLLRWPDGDGDGDAA
jgi:hypothetical protein